MLYEQLKHPVRRGRFHVRSGARGRRCRVPNWAHLGPIGPAPSESVACHGRTQMPYAQLRHPVPRARFHVRSQQAAGLGVAKARPVEVFSEHFALRAEHALFSLSSEATHPLLRLPLHRSPSRVAPCRFHVQSQQVAGLSPPRQLAGDSPALGTGTIVPTSARPCPLDKLRFALDTVVDSLSSEATHPASRAVSHRLQGRVTSSRFHVRIGVCAPAR